MTKTVLLGDMVNHFKGLAFKSKDYQPSGVPIVKVSNFTSDGVDSSKLEHVPERVANTSQSVILKQGDIVIATVGSWPNNPASVVGKTVRIPREANGALLNQNAVALRHNSGNSIEQQYIYYCLKSSKFIDYLVGGAQGSANQASITLNNIFRYKINNFGYTTKKNIVETLSSIDEKIELNRRMNEALEQMGQALFKHYFIDNPEAKTWPIDRIGKLFDLTMGLSPKGESYNLDSDGVPLLNGAADFENGKIKPSRHTSTPTRISKIGDVIFCIRGTIGNVSIGYEKYCLGRGVAAMSPKENALAYTYFSTIRAIVEMTASASGSVIKGLSKNDISDRKVNIPPVELLKTYESIGKPLIEKIKINADEIDSLTAMRDSLLPRLISGKIRI